MVPCRWMLLTKQVCQFACQAWWRAYRGDLSFFAVVVLVSVVDNESTSGEVFPSSPCQSVIFLLKPTLFIFQEGFSTSTLSAVKAANLVAGAATTLVSMGFLFFAVKVILALRGLPSLEIRQSAHRFMCVGGFVSTLLVLQACLWMAFGLAGLSPSAYTVAAGVYYSANLLVLINLLWLFSHAANRIRHHHNGESSTPRTSRTQKQTTTFTKAGLGRVSTPNSSKIVPKKSLISTVSRLPSSSQRAPSLNRHNSLGTSFCPEHWPSKCRIPSCLFLF